MEKSISQNLCVGPAPKNGGQRYAVVGRKQIALRANFVGSGEEGSRVANGKQSEVAE